MENLLIMTERYNIFIYQFLPRQIDLCFYALHHVCLNNLAKLGDAKAIPNLKL